MAQYAVDIATYKTINLATSLPIIASHSIVFVVFVIMSTTVYLRLGISDAVLKRNAAHRNEMANYNINFKITGGAVVDKQYSKAQ